MRFAKRTIASTKLSKRIGWLNKNAGLSQEIQYSEVKDLLTQVGDAEAMRILGNLEEKDQTIRDPTAYLKAAALRELEGGGKGKGERGKKAAGGRREAKGQGREAKGQGREGEDAQDRREGLQQKVEKRIQWLNANANLREELLLDEVCEPLVGAGQRQAMRVLKMLEEQAEEVMDPGAFVIAALEDTTAGGDDQGDDQPEDASDGGGEAPAGRGGRRRRGKGGGGKASGPGAPGAHVIKTGLKDKGNRDISDQVQKRFEWLNFNAGLAQELDFDRIGHLLVRTGNLREVMKILKVLEDNAGQVRDPNAYVARAVKNSIQDRPREDRPREDGPPPQQNKLFKKMRWMNQNVPLAVPMDIDRISGFIEDMDPEQVMGVLRRLEVSAHEVRDPSAYVIAGVRRLSEEGPPPPRREQGAYSAPPALPGPAPPPPAEAKLEKRIAWLNSHIPLSSPLIYERVAPDLLSVDLLTAFEVLNNLEENVETVRDPNAYVVARARRGIQSSGPAPSPRGGYDGGGPGVKGGGKDRPPRPSDRRGGQTPPPDNPSQEDRLVKRILWLNRNVCPGSPLSVDEVMPPLMVLTGGQAMEVLKKFEDCAHEVRNPSAFVIAAARRADGIEPYQKDRGRRTNRGKDDWDGGGRLAIGSAPPPRGGSRRTPIGYPGAPPSRGSSRGAPMMALPGAPAMDEKITYYGGAEEKLRKRIDWLNENVPMSSALASEKVVPELLKVKPRDAMEILKRLEDGVDEVRDPTGYVISHARRRNGQSGRRRRGNAEEGELSAG